MQSLDFKAKTLISPLYLGTMALVLLLIPFALGPNSATRPNHQDVALSAVADAFAHLFRPSHHRLQVPLWLHSTARSRKEG
jgi:hypothetical protein